MAPSLKVILGYTDKLYFQPVCSLLSAGDGYDMIPDDPHKDLWSCYITQRLYKAISSSDFIYACS